ncbi:hypothetical protein [Paracoccus benzoatiresistens]|uniref:Phasin family protein n=1 Tax=Paracoccus benzoatiresistens TaxID=2997341 RepID=A0ABT4J9W1_9RHOB|nr:hypothetical protein [Paracoccus sp. EF6]MCZ0963868.1 hypothetical protein [Paracoccus sp. EF6]
MNTLMIAGTYAWADLAKASSNMMKTNIRVKEMMIASGSVIGSRMTTMGDAACRPAQGDYAEIAGMMQEKVVTFAKVNQALVKQWSAMLADAAEQAQHLRHLMLGGRPLSIGDMSGLADRWIAHGTRMITRTMDTGGLALAPVHQQATANARRLR